MSNSTKLGSGASRQVASRVVFVGSVLVLLLVGACAPIGAPRAAPASAQAKSADRSPSSPQNAPPQSPPSPQDPSLMKRMLEPGAEAAALARLVGSWNVTMTMRPAPDAPPIVTDGMVAERRMDGLYLTETMT